MVSGNEVINIFKKKPVYKFNTDYSLDWVASTIKDKSQTWNTSTFDEAVWLFLAKHAKKQFRWARKGDRGKEYHYYLDEKHITYIDLTWPVLAKTLRKLNDA